MFDTKQMEKLKEGRLCRERLFALLVVVLLLETLEQRENTKGRRRGSGRGPRGAVIIGRGINHMHRRSTQAETHLDRHDAGRGTLGSQGECAFRNSKSMEGHLNKVYIILCGWNMVKF